MNLTTIAALPGSGAGCAAAVRAEVNEPSVTPLADPGHTHDVTDPGVCHSPIVTRIEPTGALDGPVHLGYWPSFHP